MLRCEGLRKSYGDRQAVKGVSFTIAEDECYGLLGPNGAGKTTTISMLCGLTIPDQGEVTVDGFAGGTLEAKAAVGYVPQDLALYPDLSAVENLTFFGQLYGLGGKELQGRKETMHSPVDAVSLRPDAGGRSVRRRPGSQCGPPPGGSRRR